MEPLDQKQAIYEYSDLDVPGIYLFVQVWFHGSLLFFRRNTRLHIALVAHSHLWLAEQSQSFSADLLVLCG